MEKKISGEKLFLEISLRKFDILTLPQKKGKVSTKFLFFLERDK